MPHRIKVLFLAADPFVDARLSLDREARGIAEAIRAGVDGDAFEFATEWALRSGDLQGALLRHKPQVVHYAGHASAGAGVFLEDEQGVPQAVSREALRDLLFILRRGIRVVVLNACESLSSIEAFRDVIDYTIGMKAAIGDRAAITFSKAFYGALACGTSAEEAFALGVNRLRIDGIDETGNPQLLVRDGADPTPLVERRETGRDEASGLISISHSTVGDVKAAHGDNAVFIDRLGR